MPNFKYFARKKAVMRRKYFVSLTVLALTATLGQAQPTPDPRQFDSGARQLESLLKQSRDQSHSILELNMQAAAWAAAVAEIPDDHQRQLQFQWGLQPAVLPVIAPAFSPDLLVRANAAGSIARLQGSEKDWLIARLLRDSDTYVQFATVAAIQHDSWGPLTTNALVQDALAQNTQPQYKYITLTRLRADGFASQMTADAKPLPSSVAQPIRIDPQESTIGYSRGLEEACRSLLRRADAKLLAKTLTDTTHDIAVTMARYGVAGDSLNPFAQFNPVRQVGYFELFRMAAPQEAVPYLLFIAQNRKSGGIHRKGRVNSAHGHLLGTRTLPILLAIVVAQKDPADFGFHEFPPFIPRPPSEEAQDHALELIRTYWQEQGVNPWQPDVQPIANDFKAFMEIQKKMDSSIITLGPDLLPKLPQRVMPFTSSTDDETLAAPSFVTARLTALLNACHFLSADDLRKQMNLNLALSRWAFALIGLPDDKALRYFSSGASPNTLSAISAAYSADGAQRIIAAQVLGKIPDPWVEPVLLHLLTDLQANVRWATMDAIWDRVPSADLSAALAHFVTAEGNAHWEHRTLQIEEKPVTIQLAFAPFQSHGFYNDHDFASSELMHWRGSADSSVVDYLKNLADDIAHDRPLSPERNVNPLEPVQHYLLDSQPRAAIPYLLYLINRPIDVPSKFWNPGFTTDMPVDDRHNIPLLILAKATGEKLQRFHFRTFPIKDRAGRDTGESVLGAVSYHDVPDAISQMNGWWRARGITPWTPPH